MTTVERSIYEASTETLFEGFKKIIHQKAYRLKRLQEIDIMEFAEKHGSDSAQWKFKEIDALEHELNVLLAVASYINDMSEFYDNDIQELTNKITIYDGHIQELKEYALSTLENL